MASTVKNLNSRHLSEESAKKAKESIKALEKDFADILVNISGDERRRYGSISEQNKLLVNKVYDFLKNHPELGSPDVDWDEFEKDYKSRVALESIIMSLQKIIDGLNNAKTLFDFDNYQAALDDYAYTVYKARTATPGFENKQKEIKQFFTRTHRKFEERPTEDK